MLPIFTSYGAPVCLGVGQLDCLTCHKIIIYEVSSWKSYCYQCEGDVFTI